MEPKEIGVGTHRCGRVDPPVRGLRNLEPILSLTPLLSFG